MAKTHAKSQKTLASQKSKPKRKSHKNDKQIQAKSEEIQGNLDVREVQGNPGKSRETLGILGNPGNLW